MGLSLWVFDCDREGCTGHSKIPTSRIKAKRSGIRHNLRVHGEHGVEARLRRIKNEE